MKPVLLLSINPESYPENAVARVKALAQGYDVVVTTDRSDIEAMLDRIEIVFDSFPHDLLAKASALRWYQQRAAGVDWVVEKPEVLANGLAITTSSGVHAVPISEHILAYLLADARGFPSCIRGQKSRVWSDSRRQPLRELSGARCLLLGVGAIGARFAVLAAACEMEVVGVKRSVGACPEGVSRIVGPDQLDTELPEADYIVNTLPYTPDTHHLLGKPEFDRVKPGAYFVNIGRGRTVDQAALIDALRDDRLRGAGLDVFEIEPLPEDSPLWDMEQVILTPHYSGLTPRYDQRLFEIFIDNLERYVGGRELKNLVDKDHFY